MKEVKRNIWEIYEYLNTIIVIPTNIGWKRNGCNVLGAGLAKDFVSKYYMIAGMYGKLCKLHKENLGVSFFPDQRALMFPVKPLNKELPNFSWAGNATLERIEQSFKAFDIFWENNAKDNLIIDERKFKDLIFLFPVVGCGNGKLKDEDVLPLMKKYLDKYKNVIIVHRP